MEYYCEKSSTKALIVINILIHIYFAETRPEPLCPILGFKKIKSSLSTISPVAPRQVFILLV